MIYFPTFLNLRFCLSAVAFYCTVLSVKLHLMYLRLLSESVKSFSFKKVMFV